MNARMHARMQAGMQARMLPCTYCTPRAYTPTRAPASYIPLRAASRRPSCIHARAACTAASSHVPENAMVRCSTACAHARTVSRTRAQTHTHAAPVPLPCAACPSAMRSLSLCHAQPVPLPCAACPSATRSLSLCYAQPVPLPRAACPSAMRSLSLCHAHRYAKCGSAPALKHTLPLFSLPPPSLLDCTGAHPGCPCAPAPRPPLRRHLDRGGWRPLQYAPPPASTSVPPPTSASVQHALQPVL
jgi:hypothetical protein